MSMNSFEAKILDHFPFVVDFRSAGELPYDHRSVINTDTRFAPNEQGRGCFLNGALILNRKNNNKAISDDANSSTPMPAPDDVLLVWRRTAYL